MIRLFFLLFGFATLNASSVIHEAFVLRIVPNPIVQAISMAPPQAYEQEIPPKPSPNLLWIPGYWAWDLGRGDYQWVCGVYRQPPPNHVWIPGFWKNVGPEGWVRCPGFWSSTPLPDLAYIPQNLPASLTENPGDPPEEDFFWLPGYWSYINQQFVWLLGQWEKLDPNWIFTPAHYIFRPDGYVFVPPYWDWPLEMRGVAYRCPSQFSRIGFLEPFTSRFFAPSPIGFEEYLPNLVEAYPDYLVFFAHHHHFHRDFWNRCGCNPPWWRWKSWWGLPWRDHWGLWWWYGHPGYPQPEWLSPSIARQIPPPNQQVVNILRRSHPPINVTPHGVVSSHSILQKLGKSERGRFRPILPSNPTTLDNFKKEIIPQERPSRELLLPTGKKGEETVLQFPAKGGNLEKYNKFTLPQKPVIEVPQQKIEARDQRKENLNKNKSQNFGPPFIYQPQNKHSELIPPASSRYPKTFTESHPTSPKIEQKMQEIPSHLATPNKSSLPDHLQNPQDHSTERLRGFRGGYERRSGSSHASHHDEKKDENKDHK